MKWLKKDVSNLNIRHKKRGTFWASQFRNIFIVAAEAFGALVATAYLGESRLSALARIRKKFPNSLDPQHDILVRVSPSVNFLHLARSLNSNNTSNALNIVNHVKLCCLNNCFNFGKQEKWKAAGTPTLFLFCKFLQAGTL